MMDHVGKGFRNYMNRPGNSEKFEQMVQSILADSDVQLFLSKHEDQLSQAMVTNSYSKLHEFVQEKRKLARGEEGQNPGYIPELAINAGYIDVVYKPSPD